MSQAGSDSTDDSFDNPENELDDTYELESEELSATVTDGAEVGEDLEPEISDSYDFDYEDHGEDDSDQEANPGDQTASETATNSTGDVHEDESTVDETTHGVTPYDTSRNETEQLENTYAEADTVVDDATESDGQGPEEASIRDSQSKNEGDGSVPTEQQNRSITSQGSTSFGANPTSQLVNPTTRLGFANLILLIGVLSLIAPILADMTDEYVPPELLAIGVVPLLVACLCWWCLIRHDMRGWYVGIVWGVVTVLFHLFILTEPDLSSSTMLAIASPVLGPVVITLGLSRFFGVISMVSYEMLAGVGMAIGGLIVCAGYFARPSGWTKVPEVEKYAQANRDSSTPTSAEPSTQSQSPSSEQATSGQNGREESVQTEHNGQDNTTVKKETEVTETIDEEYIPPDEFDPTEIQDLLEAADAQMRMKAVRSVAEATINGVVSDETAIDSLAERLEIDDDPTVRVATCEALGQIGTGRARSLLEDQRLSPDRDVSRAAVRALRQTNTNEKQ